MSRASTKSQLNSGVVEIFDHDVRVDVAQIRPDSSWSLLINTLSPGNHNFTAKTPNGQVISKPWDINAVAPLSIGANHSMAISNYYIVRGKPPEPGPAKAQYQRIATGGVPPYTYSSSNLEVAKVGEFGMVSAAGNGSAVIEVRDSVNNVARYTISFSGIQQVALGAPVSWGQSESDRPWVAASLSLQEMQLFYISYSPYTDDITAFLGWSDPDYWTSTNIAGLQTAYAFRLNFAFAYSAHGGTVLRSLLRA